MSTGIVIVIVIVVVVVLLAIAAISASRRSRRRATERGQYGPEYDRLATEVGPRKADAEFAKRRQRVEGLHIRPLSDERRTAYASQWEAAQEQFVDQPTQAVSTAGALVTAVAVDRGYEAGDHGQFLTDLSVHHGHHLDEYRRALQATERGDQASTEDQRQALLDYRGLFFELLESADDGTAPGRAVGGEASYMPWKQATQGRHSKTERQESSDVAATRR